MTVPFTPPFAALWSFADLCAYLHEEEVTFTGDAYAQVVEIPTRVAGLATSMLVAWEWRRPLVQIIQAVATDLPRDRLDPIERALGRLNHVAPIAGYGLDLARRLAYFRATLERDEHQRITVSQLNRALRAAITAAQTALPVVTAITAPATMARAA
jgi:hypothetical protein